MKLKYQFLLISLMWLGFISCEQNNTPETPSTTQSPCKIIFKSTLPWDELRVGDQIWTKPEGTLTPGKYQVIARKAGYRAFQREISVPMTEELIVIDFIAIARKVQITVHDNAHPDKILNAQIAIGQGEKFTPLSSEAPLSPGSYVLQVHCPGYRSFQKEITIEPATTAFIYKVFLDPIYRRFIFKAIAVGESISEITVEQISLNDKSIVNGDNVIPGEYTLRVSHKGYQPITEKISIGDEEGDFIYTIKLQCVPPPVQLIHEEPQPTPIVLNLKIFVDYPSGPIQPDKVLVDNREFKGEITPGMHDIAIYKAGYLQLQEKIFIQSAQSPQEFTRFMRVLPRQIQLKFVDEAEKELTPEDVRVSGEIVDFKNIFKLKPGEYYLDIKLAEDRKFSENLAVTPGDEILNITIILKNKS